MLCTSLGTAGAAELLSHKLQAQYWGGVALDNGQTSLSRISLTPSARWQLGDQWRADLAILAEHADDQTGLGSLDTYADASRPLLDEDDARIEITRATLTRRLGNGNLMIGKQTVPWGVLDGVRITDRFDAIRTRDFVLTDIRPQRLSRWGMRWRGSLGAFHVDAAIVADPTVSQLARQGDTFEALAPRLRGGLSSNAPSLPLVVSPRSEYRQDATMGLRIQRRVGNVDVSLLSLSGPDTDPLLRLARRAATAAVMLDYPTRALHGITLEGPLGRAIWRMEAALIPDQPVNLVSALPLAVDTRRRILAGLALEAHAPGGWFVNAQIAVDRVQQGREQLVRPHQDVIATLRAQRRFLHDTLELRTEVLSTLSDGDGVVRPMIEWRASNQLKLALGGDLLFGERTGLFGQYRDASRIWVRATLSI